MRTGLFTAWLCLLMATGVACDGGSEAPDLSGDTTPDVSHDATGDATADSTPGDATADSTPDGTPDAGPDGKVDAGPDGKVDVTPDGTAEVTPDGTADATPDVVPDATPDAIPDAIPDVVHDATPDVIPDATPDVIPDATPDVIPDATPDATPDAVPDATPDATPDAVPDATPDVTTDVGPVEDVPVVCTPKDYQGCYDTEIYWYDSCGKRGALAKYCTAPEICVEDVALGTVACGIGPTCDSDSDCYAAQYCGEGQCLPDLCTPGTIDCAAGVGTRCNSRGSSVDVVVECKGGEICKLGGSNPTCACETDAFQACANTDIYWFDSCGTKKKLVQYCTTPAECQLDADGAPICVDVETSTCPVCPGKTVCDAGMETPVCVSSVASPDAEFYEQSCTLTQFLANPTALEADCRCFDNRSPAQGVPQCVGAQYLDAAVRFGDGPSVRPLPQAHINGGVVDGAAREVIAGVDWSSATHPHSGLIMAFDLDSGDRRIISGAYSGVSGVTETGAGPSFHKVIDVERGPDGDLYALSVPSLSLGSEVVRVDPVTGDRTLVWKNGDAAFAQCASGDGTRPLRVWGEAFALDAAGDFYLAFGGAGFYSEGTGIIRVGADGQSCEFVTRSAAGSLNDYAEEDIGGGFIFDRGRFLGLTFHEGQLYGMHDAWTMLVRIDPVTGDRTVVSSASTSMGVVGSGPANYGGIGMRWLQYDAARGFMWAAGVINTRTITAVDLTTGDRTEAFCRSTNPVVPWRALCLNGVAESGFQNWGGFWVDPVGGDLIIAHENFTLTRVEVETGNSMRLSL